MAEPFWQSNLGKRLISAAVLMPLALAAVWFGGWAYALPLIAIWLLMGEEWFQLTRRPQALWPNIHRVMMALALLVCAAKMLGTGWWPVLGILWLHLMIGWRSRDYWPVLGSAYLGLSLLALLNLRQHPEGFLLTVALLLAVWGTDIGGYAFGKTLKGPKLAPSISPNKTWSGLAGGALLATLALWGMAYAYPALDALAPWWLAGPLTTLVAQGGDLAESKVKRLFGKKDSGTIIPGHGGLLDRMDGVLSTAIVWYVALCATAAPESGWICH